jgi:hypothetical protein
VARSPGGGAAPGTVGPGGLEGVARVGGDRAPRSTGRGGVAGELVDHGLEPRHDEAGGGEGGREATNLLLPAIEQGRVAAREAADDLDQGVEGGGGPAGVVVGQA